MASGIQSHETPGYRAFQEHYSTLVDGIQDPAKLAGKLFSNYVITDGILNEIVHPMLDKRTQCAKLLEAVLRKLVSDSDSFWTFVRVLEEEPTLQVIAESMRKSYKKHESLQGIPQKVYDPLKSVATLRIDETRGPLQTITQTDMTQGHTRQSYIVTALGSLMGRVRGHRCWLVIFIGGLLLALLAMGGQQYITQDLQKQGEVPSVSPPLNTTHSYTGLEKLSIPRASDEIAPNNLPYVRGHFVGRDSELQEISHMLIHSIHSGVAMVSIYGAPAVGKSTLAIMIGHQLAGHGIVVRYVNVNEAHHLFVETSETVNEPPSSIHSHTTDSSSHSTDVTSHSTGSVAIPWYSYTEKKYVLTSPQKLMEWAKGLVNDTLLIFDNCDDLLQRNNTLENKFKETLKALLEASNSLRIVITSQAQILLVGGFRPYPLKELDSSSAVHLLQLQSSLISGEEGKVIAELVGNNPLGLGIVAGLVNEKISPTLSIIEDLKQHPIETLSQTILPKSLKILTVLQLSYNYLHGGVQMCSQYLSHFPGSFHRDAALNTLGMCNFSDPEHCLKTLTRRSLLEAYWHAGQPRYMFHRLIREFLQYIQSEYGYRDDRVETEFNLYYQRYYSQSIASLSQLYRRNSYRDEIINSLECDTHNFLNILQKMVKLQLDTKSVLNIAYGISNGTNLFLKVLDCNDCFVKLLRALMSLFDQKIFEFAIDQEIGLNETTLLYFNLSSVVKEWLLEFGSNIGITLCWEIFVNHHSRIEKLSTADSYTLDAYYYHPLACYLDYFSSVYFNNKHIIFIVAWLLFCIAGTIVSFCNHTPKPSVVYRIAAFMFMSILWFLQLRFLISCQLLDVLIYGAANGLIISGFSYENVDIITTIGMPLVLSIIFKILLAMYAGIFQLVVLHNHANVYFVYFNVLYASYMAAVCSIILLFLLLNETFMEHPFF